MVSLIRFHAIETVLGIALICLAALGYLSLWLVPTAVCLALAAPFAWLLAADASEWPLFSFGAATLDRAKARIVNV